MRLGPFIFLALPIALLLGRAPEAEANSRNYTALSGSYGYDAVETITTNVGYYYHEDNLNSSTALSSGGITGTQIEANVYYPFGRQQVASPQASFKVSRQFTGQIKDDETGLYYYNARYYDPLLGRFIQPDTIIAEIGNPQSYNRNSYCLNDPLTYTDPTAHIFSEWWSSTKEGAEIIWNPVSSAAARMWNKAFVGDKNPALSEPNSYNALSGGALGQPIPGVGNAATAPIKAGASALAQVGTMMTPAADERAVGLAVKEGEKAVKALAEKGDTYLYQKVGANGEHLKFGITKNPATRYTEEELNGGRLKILGQGSRKDILQLERNLHETLPIGPEEGQKVYIQKQVEQGLKPPPYVQEKPAQ